MTFHLPTLLKLFRLTFSRRHFRLRHAANVFLFFSIYVVFGLLVLTGRLLDHVFWPGFRRQPLRAPLFVIANPRSGTTLLQRLLAHDVERFSSLKLYHTIFPAISWYRFFDLLGRLDRAVGRPGRRLLDWIERKAFKGWEGVHALAFDQAEEDENLFVYKLLTPSVFLLFPWVDELPELQYVDRMPEPTRRRLMRWYTGCLRRHLYATGPEKTFLSKVVIAAGRMESVMEALPDGRVVYLVRHPYEAIPSFVKMFWLAWRAHSPQIPLDSEECRAFARMTTGYYRYYLALAKRYPPERFVTVLYEDLLRDPAGTVESIYARLGLEMSGAHRAALAEEASRRQESHRSSHTYSLEQIGLTKEWIQEELAEAFEVYGFER